MRYDEDGEFIEVREFDERGKEISVDTP